MGAKQAKDQDDNSDDDYENDLDREEIDYLLKNTHFNEEEIKQWYSGFMSDYPRGSLDKKEFIDIYKEFYTNGRGDKFCKYVKLLYGRWCKTSLIS